VLQRVVSLAGTPVSQPAVAKDITIEKMPASVAVALALVYRQPLLRVARIFFV
jgi:hypothetical protein